MSNITFAELGLPSEMVDVLSRNLIKEPFEIQALAIPDALAGRDILGRAPTGSGKTLGFGLPMLARIDKGAKKRPRGLILSPTRELAEQICRDLAPLAKAMDRNVLAVYGGTGIDKQIKALRRGVDLLVACPGRLLDLIEKNAASLEDVDMVVVDEADRMADMGFLPDVRTLLDQTADVRQTVLFSATLDRDVQILTDKYQDDPVIHEVGEVEPDLSTMEHRFIKVAKSDRIWLSADVIAATGPTVVFCRTRHGVDRLARQLKNEGIKAGYIHGGRSQSQRDRALKLFIDGKVEALVATDVAARGIHVDGVACVIHYDPPAEIKDYVHRSGRTARAGAAGVVVSFLDNPQVKDAKKLQRKLGLEAEIEPLPERMPRSSRPTVVDEKPESKSGSGKKGKPGSKPKKGKPKSKAGSKPSSDRKQRADREPRADSSTGERKSTSASPTRRSSSARSGAGRSDDRRSNGTKPGGKSKSTTRRSKPSSSKYSDSKPASAKRAGSKPSASKRDDSKRSSSRPTTSGSSSSSSSGSRSTAKPKHSSAKKRTSTTRPSGQSSESKAADSKARGSKGRTAGKATARPAKGKTKTKRSGKPRPKNRKNQPKAAKAKRS